MKLFLIISAVAVLVAAAPAEASERAVCPCEPVICIQSFPEGCYCENEAKRVCYEACGGVAPTYADCSGGGGGGGVAVPYQRCGSRGLAPCADGTVCVDDPSSSSCGQACDAAGYCVPDDVTCGGLIGTQCPVEGQLCADDPRDECDRAAGGADCIGLCFTPQVLTY